MNTRKCIYIKEGQISLICVGDRALSTKVCHKGATYPVFSIWKTKRQFLQKGTTYSVIDQSHRYGRPQEACREPVGSYGKTTRTAILGRELGLAGFPLTKTLGENLPSRL